VLERARYPRYKTCGGGLIGASLAVAQPWVTIPVRDSIHRATFTLNGGRVLNRQQDGQPVIEMVMREEFDEALAKAATNAGVAVRQGAIARGIDQFETHASVRLAEGDTVAAKVIVGADGSGGISSRHVGVQFAQVDLGLEVELPIAGRLQDDWRGRVLLDWGPIPGSYGWVFPKSDRLTVGVIASRGHGERTRAYLREFVGRLGLADIEPVQDSGHLTRCRAVDSPLRKDRVIVAGDAGGLLEPWTREGISFALRSGRHAGTAAAKAAVTGDLDALDGYGEALAGDLLLEMSAGRRLMSAFSRRPGAFHLAVATRPGWRAFVKLCRSEITFAQAADQFPVRTILALIEPRRSLA
jgi:geranylgeranyl reductase family protein